MEHLKCLYDARWSGQHGIGRFSEELNDRLLPYEVLSVGRPMSLFDSIRISIILLFNKKSWYLSPGYNGPLFSFLPYVITLHDLNHVDRIENSNVLKKIYYRVILKNICKRSSAILTVSDFSKIRICEWSGVDESKIFNVGNGVSSCFEEIGVKFDLGCEYILCVSNRKGHKNEKGVLNGFMSASLPKNVKIVFTGMPDGAIQAEIEKLNLTNKVYFTGRVTNDQLAALYRGALFLLFPSFYEGFGLPIVEAFASGTPVITSNVTSMPEIAGDAALLVDPSNIADIAAAIIKLYYSPELRSELTERGLKRVKIFSWDAVAERVKAAIKTIDTNPKHPVKWN